jgi:hypothetical protein
MGGMGGKKSHQIDKLLFTRSLVMKKKKHASILRSVRKIHLYFRYGIVLAEEK